MSSDHHSHSHGGGSVKNLKIAFFLNISFVFIEIIGGILTNSIAILSDAVHDLGDSISLGLTWYLEKFSSKESDHKFTYGYKRLSILGALLNTIVLLIGGTFVIFKAVPRLFSPESVNPQGMVALAVIGIIINGLAVLRVKKGKKLAERVVTLHLLEDLFGWAAVLIVSIVLIFVDLPILDPILSLIISVYVIKNVIGGLKKIIKMLLQGVPDGFDIEEIRVYICETSPHILEVHELRAWSLDGDENVVTFHMTVEECLSVSDTIRVKREVKALLSERGIKYVTIEVENLNDCSNKTSEECMQAEKDQNKND